MAGFTQNLTPSSRSLRASARLARGSHSYGSFPAESGMLATGSSSVIVTNGSGEPKFARCLQRTSGRDSSSDPSETRNSRRDVVAAPGWRRIVNLRFFVGGVLGSNRGNSPMVALFGNAPLGTKGVICVSGNRPEVSMSGSRDQNRIQPVDPDHATGAIRRLFAEIRAKFALVPNLLRVVANAPAALEGLMGLSAALARGALDEKTREQLALAIAESNLCAYCLSGHTAMAAKIGLSRVEIDDAIRASAADARTDAILKLARSIVVQRGELSDADLGRARAGGLSDGEIVETVANVALNIFENYMSHVARVPIDFPQSQSRETSD